MHSCTFAAQNVLSVILCMQCDSRKIIVGSLNRTITYVILCMYIILLLS